MPKFNHQDTKVTKEKIKIPAWDSWRLGGFPIFTL
jgi:hypothetical protein